MSLYSSSLDKDELAFERFVRVNIPESVIECPSTAHMREAIAFTVVDLIDMHCDPLTVHELANGYRARLGIPPIRSIYKGNPLSD